MLALAYDIGRRREKGRGAGERRRGLEILYISGVNSNYWSPTLLYTS
jgi:hypothetical protein